MKWESEFREISAKEAAAMVVAFAEDFWECSIDEPGRDLIARYCAAPEAPLLWCPAGMPEEEAVPPMLIQHARLWIDESLDHNGRGSLVLVASSADLGVAHWLEVGELCDVRVSRAADLWMARVPVDIAHLLGSDTPAIMDEVMCRWDELLVNATPDDLRSVLLHENPVARALALRAVSSLRKTI